MLKPIKYTKLSGEVAALILLSCTLPLSAEEVDKENPIEVIVVEGSKHGTELGVYDSSVTIKTAKQLEEANVTQVQDLEKVFPGLLIRTRGSRVYASGTVRGISSPDFYSPSIQVYVDGAPQDSAFLTQELVNVSSVELLRGPQGTLYGANAQGGIINIITRKGESFTKASVTYANNEKEVSVLVAGELFSNFSADISLRGLNENGQVTHTTTNNSDADESDTLAGVARLHYLPDDSPLSLTFSIAKDKLDSHEEWYLSQSDFDARSTNANIPVLDREVNTFSFSGNYELDNSLLTGVASVQDRKISRQFIGGIQNENQETKYAELRLSTEYNNNTSSVVGINFKDEGFTRYDAGFTGYYSASSNAVNKYSQALFGEVRTSLAEAVDLTVGWRFARQKTEINFGGRSSDFPPFAINAFTNSSSETLTSPKASLGWQLNENNRLYISYTRGYRPNGFNYAVGNIGDKNPFSSEKSDNFESGWRYDSGEGLSLDAALYWINLDQMQLYVGNIGSQVINNVGEAESKGVEFNATYSVNNIRTNLGANIGSSRFKDSVDPITNTNISDNHLPYAPDIIMSIGFTYTIPNLGSGDLSLGINSIYNDDVFFNEANTLKQEAYTLTDLFIAYDIGNTTVELFGKNITDKEYSTYRFQYGPSVLSNYAQGRVIGVKLTSEF